MKFWNAVRQAIAIPETVGRWRRVIQLVPIVEAELARGNRVVGDDWTRVREQMGPDVYTLDLAYPVDASAISAEFRLPPSMETHDGVFWWLDWSNYRICGLYEPDADRRAAVNLWWDAWRSGPAQQIEINVEN